jgi:hypothetical protein
MKSIKAIEKHFKELAHRLTETPIDEIKVISVTENPDGSIDGIVEIDGRREWLHGQIC